MGVHLLAWIFLLTPGLNTLYLIWLLVKGKLIEDFSIKEQLKDLFK